MADISWLSVFRETVRSRNPELWRRRNSCRNEYCRHIAVNERGIVIVNVIAWTIPAVGKNVCSPGFVIIAHRFRYGVHPLQIEEDHGTTRESLGRSASDCVLRVNYSTSTADELARAAGAFLRSRV